MSEFTREEITEMIGRLADRINEENPVTASTLYLLASSVNLNKEEAMMIYLIPYGKMFVKLFGDKEVNDAFPDIDR